MPTPLPGMRPLSCRPCCPGRRELPSGGAAGRHFLPRSPGPQLFLLDSSQTAPSARGWEWLLPLAASAPSWHGMYCTGCTSGPLCVCDNRAFGHSFVALCALQPGGPGPGAWSSCASKCVRHRAAREDSSSRHQNRAERVVCVFCPRVRALLAKCTVPVGLDRERDKDPLLRSLSEVVPICRALCYLLFTVGGRG